MVQIFCLVARNMFLLSEKNQQSLSLIGLKAVFTCMATSFSPSRRSLMVLKHWQIKAL